ncbi:hypothetical protein FQZ97_453390 [compost metagenome]
MHALGDTLLQLAHGRCQVATADIDIDPAGQPPVLAAQHRRPFAQSNLGHRAQGDLLTACGENRHAPQRLRAIAPLPGVAQADGEAGQPFDCFTDIAATDGTGHHRLHVGDAQAIARRGQAIDLDVHIAPAGEAFRQRRTHPGHLFGYGFDIAGDAFDVGQRGAGDLDPDRALDPRGQHVDAVADRRHPDVGKSWDFHRTVQFLDEFFRRHLGSPLLARLELHRGLEHFQRRRVGGCLRPPGLAEHPRHFRHREDHAVGLLQQLAGLAGR